MYSGLRVCITSSVENTRSLTFTNTGLQYISMFSQKGCPQIFLVVVVEIFIAYFTVVTSIIFIISFFLLKSSAVEAPKKYMAGLELTKIKRICNLFLGH